MSLRSLCLLVAPAAFHGARADVPWRPIFVTARCSTGDASADLGHGRSGRKNSGAFKAQKKEPWRQGWKLEVMLDPKKHRRTADLIVTGTNTVKLAMSGGAMSGSCSGQSNMNKILPIALKRQGGNCRGNYPLLAGVCD